MKDKPEKLCPFLLNRRIPCKGEKCAIYVTSSGRCAIKDIAHSIKQPIELIVNEGDLIK